MKKLFLAVIIITLSFGAFAFTKSDGVNINDKIKILYEQKKILQA